MLTNVVISGRSSNGKTGAIPTISRPIEATCPTTCPFLPKTLGGNGLCYANGRTNGTVRKLAHDMTVAEAVAKITKDRAKDPAIDKANNRHGLIRDRVVGDVALPDGSPDLGYLRGVAEVADATGLTAYGYTHVFTFTPEDVQTVAAMGYVLNASCNTPEDVRRAVDLGMPTTIASDEIKEGEIIAGRRSIVCPEQTGRVKSCADCGLCAKPNRAVTVIFRMH